MKLALELLTLLLIGASSNAPGKLPNRAQQPVTLTELTKTALTTHPTLAAARADIDSARAKKTELLAPFQPLISLNGYAAAGSGSMIFPGTVEPFNYELLAGGATGVINGAFMWRLFTFGLDKELAASGSGAVRSSEAALAAESLDVIFNLRIAFSDALLKHAATGNERTSLEDAQEILKVTQAQFDDGKLPEAFVLRAKAETASADRDLAMAEADEAGAVSEVWDTAGLDQSPTLTLGDWDAVETAPADLSDAIKTALLNRPELDALKDQIQEMKSMASAAGKSSLPELSLMGMNDVADSGGDSYKAGLVLSFPLGDGGQRQAQKQEANASALKAEAALRSTRNKIQAQVASAWAEWQATPRVSDAAKADLTSSQEAFRVAMLRYQAGKAILAELTDATTQLTKARFAVAEADAYRRNAWSKLERAVGEPPHQP